MIYVGLVLAQYLTRRGCCSEPWLADESSVAAAAHRWRSTRVALNVFGFFAVALLSGSLAESVRSAGARLEQASTEIADLQALNQHVIDSLPSGLVTTDQQQRILTFNHAAETITGLSFRLGRRPPGRRSAAAAAPVVDALERGLTERRASRVEFRYRDGRRPRRDRHRPERDAPRDAGRPRRVPVTFQDVTDIKKLERDARMQQRLAAVGEMAAGIAHEIRNPLASMSGSIQILRQELPLSAEQEQLMDIVLRESERLNTTIRSFLAYARPQRFADRALRRPPRAERHGAAAAQQRRGRRGARDRRRRAGRPSCGTRPTKGRSSRSSGTWPPTACARCPTAAGCGSAGASTPNPDGVGHHRAGRRHRHPARGARRPVPAVSRHASRKAAASAWPSSTAS